jgi:hypothetical protein
VGIGMFIHSVLDLFFWFAQVKIFWPFGGKYSIWGNLFIPDAFWNIMSSLECFSYGIFIYIFYRLTKINYSFFYKIVLVLLILCTAILLPIGYHLSRIEFESISYGIAIVLGFIPSVIIIKKYFHAIV